MAHDFSDLTPPDDLVNRWRQDFAGFQHAARWGASQAAERLAGQWPEPITDRPPTEADRDDDNWVQFLDPSGRWDYCHWQDAAADGDPWRHTPRYSTPAPPSLKKQNPLEEAAESLIVLWENGFRIRQEIIDELRRALEADS